jgi:hypothetical protein
MRYFENVQFRDPWRFFACLAIVLTPVLRSSEAFGTKDEKAGGFPVFFLTIFFPKFD